MEDYSSLDISGYDWIGQDGAELFSDVQRVNSCNLRRREEEGGEGGRKGGGGFKEQEISMHAHTYTPLLQFCLPLDPLPLPCNQFL